MVNKRERRNLKFFVGGGGSVEGGVNEQLSRKWGGVILASRQNDSS